MSQLDAQMYHTTSQNYCPILFPLHPLFLIGSRQQGEHIMVLALCLGSAESPKPRFIPLAVKGFLTTSVFWVTLVDECFFCSDIILITLGNHKLAGKAVGVLSLGKNQEGLLLHVAWVTLITAFFSFCLTRNFCSLLPYRHLQIVSHLVFPLLSTREKLGTHMPNSCGC